MHTQEANGTQDEYSAYTFGARAEGGDRTGSGRYPSMASVFIVMGIVIAAAFVLLGAIPYR